MVQCQPRQNSSHDPILKNPSQNRAGGVAQYEGPEFKPPTGEKKNWNNLCILSYTQPHILFSICWISKKHLRIRSRIIIMSNKAFPDLSLDLPSQFHFFLLLSPLYSYILHVRHSSICYKKKGFSVSQSLYLFSLPGQLTIRSLLSLLSFKLAY
jgi:hypothetical protein